MSEPPSAQTELPAPPTVVPASEQRARRTLIIGLVVVGILLLGMVAVLVLLSIDAYHTAAAYQTAIQEQPQVEVVAVPAPSPSGAVIGLLRDVAIVLVAFETLIIGALLAVLMLQVQALVRLLRDEIQPLLATLNETAATVRGTAQFVSTNVVSPTIQAASFLAGVRRVLKEFTHLVGGR